MLAVVLCLFVPAAGSSAPPPLRVGDATAEATGPDGADATYNVKAFDPGTGTPLDATCDTPAGTAGTGDFDVTGHFPLGQTTVTCQTTCSASSTRSTAPTAKRPRTRDPDGTGDTNRTRLRP